MAVESWSQYVSRVAGTYTQIQIAKKSGLSQASVGAWLRGEPGVPRAESVITFARAFNQSPIAALVAAGYLTDEEAGTVGRTPLSQYSRDELFDELSNRFPES